MDVLVAGKRAPRPQHDAALEQCKEALRNELYVPADSDTRIVVSDASCVGWAGLVAACATAEIDKPVAESKQGLAIRVLLPACCCEVDRIPH